MLSAEKALSETIEQLKYENRFRVDFLKTELALTNRIRDLGERVGHVQGGNRDECADDHQLLDDRTRQAEGRTQPDAPISTALAAPLEDSRKVLKKARTMYQRRMEKLAKTLPVWPWVEQVRGVGPLMLAQITAEAGNLSDYSNPAKLWKRFGLATDPEHGRQRRAKGPDGVMMGFNPARRAVMWNCGECLIKQNKDGFRHVYDERKAYETKRGPEMTKGKAHARAKRYMEKRFLLKLWKAWRKAAPTIQPVTTGSCEQEQ